MNGSFLATRMESFALSTFAYICIVHIYLDGKAPPERLYRYPLVTNTNIRSIFPGQTALLEYCRPVLSFPTVTFIHRVPIEGRSMLTHQCLLAMCYILPSPWDGSNRTGNSLCRRTVSSRKGQLGCQVHLTQSGRHVID